MPIQEAQIQVDGRPVAAERLGRYLSVRSLAPGARVTLTFPVAEHSYAYVANQGTAFEQAYSFLSRGSTLVAVQQGPEPKPNELPLYVGREKLRTPQAPRKAVERFVGDRAFTAW